MSTDQERQEPAEIEITAEMIAAGADALSLWDPADRAATVVSSVFSAMARAAPKAGQSRFRRRK